MLGRSDIQALIPHAGNMCLLSSVAEWDEKRISCIAQSHRDSDNPLSSNGKLAALCGIEYAAQAMAVHGGLTNLVSQRPRAGLLVGLRNVIAEVKYLNEFKQDLRIEAEQLAAGNEGVMYQFALYADTTLLLSGRATIILDSAGKFS